MPLAEAKLLEAAFSEFSKASDSIISHYSILENQIKDLRKEIEEKNRALKQASEYLYTILDSLPVGVAVVDRKAVLFVNKDAEDLVSEGIISKLNQAQTKNGEVKTGRGHFRWKKEKLYDGLSEKEVIVIEDVTEVERTKERNERDERLLAMGEMAARISHEIKNPLGSMELFLSMLLSGKLNKTQRKHIEYVQFGVKTIDRIINNILSYTRPKALTLRQGELFDIVKDTIEFMNVSMSVREIQVDFQATSRGSSYFDPDLMKLVLMNLVSNAMEAIGTKGRIKIDIKETQSSAVLIISDSGIGMQEEIRKNIFNPFFTTKEKGVGLGLYIVYNIIKAHNGFIEVESAENSGSSFLIYLPKEKVCGI